MYLIKVSKKHDKSLEDGVIFVTDNDLICLSLRSNSFELRHPQKYSEYKRIFLKDRSAVYFWEKKGKTEISKINFPIDIDDKIITKTVYQCNREILVFKSTFIDNIEYIYVYLDFSDFRILEINYDNLTDYGTYYCYGEVQ